MTRKELFFAGYRAAVSADYRDAEEAWLAFSRARADKKLSAQAFHAMLGQATANAQMLLGPKWYLSGQTFLFEVPRALRAYRTERGTLVSIRRDMRAPAAVYWPCGVVPECIAPQADIKTGTAPILCDSLGHKTPQYDAWLEDRFRTCPEYDLSGRESRIKSMSQPYIALQN